MPPIHLLLYTLPFLLLLAFLARILPPPLSTLRDKHVWIIGASRGLGAALARLCALHGARVTVSSRTLTPTSPIVQTLRNLNALGAIIPLDQTADWATLSAAVDSACRVAPLDVVILNAGINHRGRRFDTLTHADVDAVIAVNFTGVARLLRLCVMRVNDGGCICVVSSLAGYRGVRGGSVYGATKAAVRVLCEAVGAEVAGRVDVVCACPGFVDTDAIRSLHHPKPMLMTEDAAALEVMRGVLARWRVYGFPWLMEQVVMRLARAAPTAFYERVLRMVDH